MDPDATLRLIRVMAEPVENGRRGYDRHEAIEELEHLAELVRALDRWLSRGGCLPKEWQGKGAVGR
jgi:hypothetical protein